MIIKVMASDGIINIAVLISVNENKVTHNTNLMTTGWIRFVVVSLPSSSSSMNKQALNDLEFKTIFHEEPRAPQQMQWAMRQTWNAEKEVK